MRRQDRPTKPNGLTKQTYSTYIYPPNAEAPRKWHIVAYFFVRNYPIFNNSFQTWHVQDNEYTLLPIIDNYEYLRNVKVPNGIFFSSKGMIRTAHPEFQDNYNSYKDRNSSLSSPTDSYSPVSSPTSDGHSDGTDWSTAYYSQSTTRSSTPARPHVQRAATNPSVTLPRLSALGSFLPHAGSSSNVSHGNLYAYNQKQTSYRSLSPEDRRALDTFRVVL